MSGSERRFHGTGGRESVVHSAPLLAVAHGSRDPRSAATIRRLVDRIRAQAPGLDARAAFLDLSEPTVGDALAALHADGHREVAVVPLLLGSAYHARVDLPELLAEAVARLPERHFAAKVPGSVTRPGGISPPKCRLAVADVLGAGPQLQAVAAQRLAAAGAPADPQLGVVLAGVGSSDAGANATVARIAARWHARGQYAAVTHAFATCGPSVADAVGRLRAQGARRVAVAPWFLAPGLLLDRVAVQARAAAPEVLVADPLGDHPGVADAVLARYTAATALAPAA